MDWLISVNGAIAWYLMGSKSKWGPIFGLLNQVLFTIYALQLNQKGLLLSVVLFTPVHLRNARLWWKSDGMG